MKFKSARATLPMMLFSKKTSNFPKEPFPAMTSEAKSSERNSQF